MSCHLFQVRLHNVAIRLFAIITVLVFLRLVKSKYDSNICILLDLTTLRKPKKTNQITECGNKASPRKVIVEWLLSAWNDISCETIRKSFKSYVDNCTTILDINQQIYAKCGRKVLFRELAKFRSESERFQRGEC